MFLVHPEQKFVLYHTTVFTTIRHFFEMQKIWGLSGARPMNPDNIKDYIGFYHAQ